MDEYIKSIKAQLYDRAISPLFGTFVLSWAAWNYKFIVVLTSSMDTEKKMLYISNVLYGSAWDRFGPGLLFPLITTFAFIYGYPYIAKPVFGYVRRRQKELKEIKQAIEDETPLTREESRALRREALTQEREFEQALQDRNSTIQQLKAIIANLEGQVRRVAETRDGNGANGADPEKVDGELKDDFLDQSQMAILGFIANHPRSETEEIVSHAGDERGRVYTEYNIGELKRRDYIQQVGFNPKNGESLYSVTHAGREKLVRPPLLSQTREVNNDVDRVPTADERGRQELVRLCAELESFWRRFNTEWQAERDSDPHITDDAKYILNRAAEELLRLNSMINSYSSAVSESLGVILMRLRSLQRHQTYIDGGVSFRAFWAEGDRIIADIGDELLKLRKIINHPAGGASV